MKLYRARYLLTAGAPPLEDGVLLVEGGRILAVGTHRELAAAHPGAAAVDFGEAVILPPLVNAHTHLELTDFPRWADGASETGQPDDFVDWIEHLVRVRRQVDAEAVLASLGHGLRQCLAAGTGAVGDILSTLSAGDAFAASPLSGRVFCEVLGVEAARVAGRLAEISVKLDTPPGPGLAWGLSPHAPYTLNRDTLAAATGFARRHDLPLAIHWAETAAEREFLATGEGAIRRLYAAAGWPVPVLPQERPIAPPGALLIHAVHLRDHDIAAIAAAGQAVVLCPRSNSRFGDGRSPVAALHRAGVPLALGTDSLASSPSLSVWAELAFARRWFAGALDPQAWLEIAFAGGARVLGLDGRMGRFTPGLDASFQVLRMPPGADAETLAEALCCAGEEAVVTALFLRGENVLPLS